MNGYPDIVNIKNVCGYYFISQGRNATRTEASEAQLKAIEDSNYIDTAASDITNLVDLSSPTGGSDGSQPDPISFKADVDAAVKNYRANAEAVIAEIDKMPLDQMQKDWLIANSQPRTSSPPLDVSDSDYEQGNSGIWYSLFGKNNDALWKIRVQVAQDMQKFEYYISQDLTTVPR